MTSNDRLLSSILVLALLCASLWVLVPFLPAIFWASVLAFATWPAMSRLTKVLNGRTTLAAAVLTTFWMLLIAVPVLLFALNLGEHLHQLSGLIKNLWVEGLPPAPQWLKGLPLIGDKAMELWTKVDQEGIALFSNMRPYLAHVGNWFLARTAQIAGGLFELSLSLVFVFFFYRSGEQIAAFAKSLLERLIGSRAEYYLNLVGGSIQCVVNGVIGTAAVQAILAMVGFMIAGVPGALLLGFATFFLSLIPMGPPIAWLPAVAWLAYQGQYGMAIFLAVWGVVIVSGVDNVLKPLLISRGSTLPMVVVLIGLFGGLLAFGFMGLFLGPTLLAVAYSLMNDWMKTGVKARTVV
ncbi:AI-2E family transporter (plasmid) [Pseudomonas silesiensis]|uniref:AI-2E family transporter n=1 Tax=Pseudomonas silesiensis TaxID=1853130 RepID=UPI0030CBB76F